MSEVFAVVVVGVVVVVVCRLCRTPLSDAPFIVTSEFSLSSLQDIVISCTFVISNVCISSFPYDVIWIPFCDISMSSVQDIVI